MSIHLFLIKKARERVSQRALNNWAILFHWAHNLVDNEANNSTIWVWIHEQKFEDKSINKLIWLKTILYLVD